MAVNRFWLVSCLLLAGQWAVAAPVGPPELLAHGDDQHMWIAHVAQLPTRPTSFRTTIFYRSEGQSKWQLLNQLPDRVIGLASQASQPAVLLDDGSWILLYTDSGPQTAGPLPMPARMVALAGGRQTWWAIGLGPAGMESATQPISTTQPSARASAGAVATTQPARTRSAQTQSGASRLALYTLSANQWTKAAELTDDISEAPNVSLAIIDDIPYVADLDTTGQLQVRHWADHKWVRDLAPIRVAQVGVFRLISDATLPRLWLAQENGPDLLYVLGQRASEPIRLQPIIGAPPAARALAVAFGKLRMVATVNGKLLERDYNPSTGTADGAAFEILLPQPSPLGILPSIQSVIVTVALIVAILASFRQWPATRGLAERLGQLPIAPLGRRFAAGLIDALPVLLAVAVLLVRLRPDREENAALQLLLVYWAASLFYVIYTTVIESLGGRTLGKVALGLRVVSIDGSPAPTTALVTRNVLRVIDVGIFFIPLLLVLLFPLRQRVGDVAAGTLVIRGEIPALQETVDQRDPVQTAPGQDGQ